MNLHSSPSATLRIFPSTLLCKAANDNAAASIGFLNILTSVGINGKNLRTRRGTQLFPHLRRLEAPHLGRDSRSLYLSPRNSMHWFGQTSIISYFKPNFFNILDASYSDVGRLLILGKISFDKRVNNSSTRTEDAPCILKQFNRSITVLRSDSRDPLNRGVRAASRK
ncbi:hypothetical protein M758_UG061500 [Ceratodon purpureus]|nr:hypothetical protein M758_UG061500 [Ceratodon purpureus]